MSNNLSPRMSFSDRELRRISGIPYSCDAPDGLPANFDDCDDWVNAAAGGLPKTLTVRRSSSG
jgi:hypothetical protein